ncbi:MAG: hypothetical protein RR847_00950 [Bacilli bacterium]
MERFEINNKKNQYGPRSIDEIKKEMEIAKTRKTIKPEIKQSTKIQSTINNMKQIGIKKWK